ncbi:heme-binding protein 2-like [Senna tora]|uniref:Heme-binding protein 2-like n=1 Tax=Senna tora TaxID=362788 RepID=A0A834TXZ9_9FABA|nr:heme-binding protein 2-like [Senna tora]
MGPQVVYLFCYCLCIAMCGTKLVEAIESPAYTVATSESDLEIRLYSESSWLSAPVRGTSFTQSTEDGFHRLYQYMHGGNLNSSKLAFTAPVLTSIPSSTSSHGNDYVVMFYVSTKYQGKPPQPNPELKLQVDKWRSHCIAVRKFSGFANDDNINKQVEALINSLSKYYGSSDTIQDKGSYSIAQYNSSRHLSGRLNEVWINVSGPNAQGCPLSH